MVPTCLVKWVPHWNTLHTTKTPQTGQATSSLQRPLDLSTSGQRFLLFRYISLMGPHRLTPCNCSQQANLFWRKIKHSTTKQSSFASRGFTLVVCRRLRKWLQLFIFKGENNLPTLLRRHALYRSSSMHPKYRIPSVAINAHHLCSSTYHLRKSFRQMKTCFTCPFTHTIPKSHFPTRLHESV